MLKKETATPIENRATDMMKMLMDTRKQVETLEKGMAILQGNQSTLINMYLEQQKRLDEQ